MEPHKKYWHNSSYRAALLLSAGLAATLMVCVWTASQRPGSARTLDPSTEVVLSGVAGGASFFSQLPIRPSTLTLKPVRPTPCKRGRIASALQTIQRFFGFDRTVYAFGGGIGCNYLDCQEQQDPYPPDCGCGMKNFTDVMQYPTGSGQVIFNACEDCSTEQGSWECPCQIMT